MNYFPVNACLNNEQISIIEGKANVIIKGAAGTGKTMTAIHLAKKLSDENYCVGIIIFQKALRRFIREAINNISVDIFSPDYIGWNNLDNKHYDYLILDEVQDMTLAQIRKAIEHQPKGIYFFGDDNQQLKFDGKRKITIKEIASETGYPCYGTETKCTAVSTNV